MHLLEDNQSWPKKVILQEENNHPWHKMVMPRLEQALSRPTECFLPQQHDLSWPKKVMLLQKHNQSVPRLVMPRLDAARLDFRLFQFHRKEYVIKKEEYLSIRNNLFCKFRKKHYICSIKRKKDIFIMTTRNIDLIILLLSSAFIFLSCSNPHGKTDAKDVFESVSPARMRVIIDNDYSGDPDGMFQLAHHLLSPSVNVVGIIGGHVDAVEEQEKFNKGQNSVEVAIRNVEQLMSILGQKDRCPVVPGATSYMNSTAEPLDSEGAQMIIREALRTDTDQPLLVCCGGGLTNIVSALLLRPEIASRIYVIWIGGPEYPDLSPLYTDFTALEPNQNIDPVSTRIFFNETEAQLIQVPRNMYRKCLYPVSKAMHDLRPLGELGSYLTTRMKDAMDGWNTMFGPCIGETYILGDSPLVLLTALMIDKYADGCIMVEHKAPRVTEDNTFVENPDGRTIKVCIWLNQSLMFDDMLCKFKMWHENQ